MKTERSATQVVQRRLEQEHAGRENDILAEQARTTAVQQEVEQQYQSRRAELEAMEATASQERFAHNKIVSQNASLRTDMLQMQKQF